ncbi:MAG: hypothetical protein IJQ77_11530 [Synergistaceae bacterium]|nr:hypothetical protein [Synergistaceae bacterium]MBR0251697.1 hypothetical protein [Synergistaceae bacterium]
MSYMNSRERLEIIEARLNLYLRAEKAILSGQSYSVEGLSLTRADLSEVQKLISELEREYLRLERKLNPAYKRSRIRYVIPGDEVRIK